MNTEKDKESVAETHPQYGERKVGSIIFVNKETNSATPKEVVKNPKMKN